jgi:hypothetical protein
MDSIVWSTSNACFTMKLLCYTLAPRHCPLQLPGYEPLVWLDQGSRGDFAAEGILVLR